MVEPSYECVQNTVVPQRAGDLEEGLGVSRKLQSGPHVEVAMLHIAGGENKIPIER